MTINLDNFTLAPPTRPGHRSVTRITKTGVSIGFDDYDHLGQPERIDIYLDPHAGQVLITPGPSRKMTKTRQLAAPQVVAMFPTPCPAVLERHTVEDTPALLITGVTQ